VLYITLLVVVTLAALGTIGVRSVQMELATAGAVRQAAQTSYVADAGAMVSMWKFAGSGNLSAFLAAMRKPGRTLPTDCYEDPDCWVFSSSDFSTAVPPIFAASKPFGASPLEPGFLVRADNRVPILTTPGYSLARTTIGGDDYEFQKWTFTSVATLNYAASTGVPSLNRGSSSETIRTTYVVGPVKREK